MRVPDRRMEFGWPGDGGVGEMLVRQIIDGQKTATCGFKVDYTPDELDEVLTGEGELYAASSCGRPPRCVIRITEVYETPFGNPDSRLVEGEGDGTDVTRFQEDHRVAWAATLGDRPLLDSELLIVELFELAYVL